MTYICINKNNDMTTTQIKRNEAKEVFYFCQNSKLFTKEETEKSLQKVNIILKNELKFSKDLRNLEYLNTLFLQRHYYKKLVSLF